MKTKTLGDVLLARRSELHVSQQTVADRAGISLRTYSHLEHDRAWRPRMVTLLKVAAVLQLDYTELDRVRRSEEACAWVDSGAQLHYIATLPTDDEQLQALRALPRTVVVDVLMLTRTIARAVRDGRL